MAEFEKWKNQEEKMTKSWYVKERADRKTKPHYTISWLRCNNWGVRFHEKYRKESDEIPRIFQDWMLMPRLYHHKNLSRDRRGTSRVLFETRWA